MLELLLFQAPFGRLLRKIAQDVKAIRISQLRYQWVSLLPFCSGLFSLSRRLVWQSPSEILTLIIDIQTAYIVADFTMHVLNLEDDTYPYVKALMATKFNTVCPYSLSRQEYKLDNKRKCSLRTAWDGTRKGNRYYIQRSTPWPRSFLYRVRSNRAYLLSLHLWRRRQEIYAEWNDAPSLRAHCRPDAWCLSCVISFWWMVCKLSLPTRHLSAITIGLCY